MTEEMTLIATTAMGLESIAANEVRRLGYEVTVENGKVIFQAPAAAIPRVNLWLRSAERVKIQMGQFPAKTFDELFEGTKALPWEDIISESGKFPVTGKSHRSTLHSVPDCQAIVKKAIAERLKLKYGLATKMPETHELYRTEIDIHKDTARLTVDTSGSGLHRRGYRIGQGDAPLKETLAAALVLLTNWKPDDILIDPFCGSGTILVEAALIGQNIAPGFMRDFASEEWGLVGKHLWERALEEAEDAADYDQPLDISGFDIDQNMIQVAEQNALEAGLSDLINWKQMQVKDLTIRRDNGYLIGNPPYGHRQEDADEVKDIYRNLGQIMEDHPSWSVYILTAFKDFEKVYGKKATKRRKLFNGFIETDYYQYFGKKIKGADSPE